MYEEELKTTYNKLIAVKPDFMEDWDVIALVHKYRMFWKPKKVKTLLLAKSHVFTDKELIKEKLTLLTGLSGYPDQYVRFVYCLAYGEDDLLTTTKPGGGTPQFWKLFNECFINRENKVLKMTNKNFNERIEEKIRLLNDMKDNGFWLLDCSIMAVYKKLDKTETGNGEANKRGYTKLPNKIYNEVLSTSFENYCLPIIKQIMPDKIIVIGKTVHDLIIEMVEKEYKDKYEYIYQPNARITNGDRKKLSSLLHNPTQN